MQHLTEVDKRNLCNDYLNGSTIKELYHMSPQKVVYFVIDLQGYKEKKKIISVEDFMELNRREQLFFNTIYKIVLLITQK